MLAHNLPAVLDYYLPGHPPTPALLEQEKNISHYSTLTTIF
jgi:hypothetical protein